MTCSLTVPSAKLEIAGDFLVRLSHGQVEQDVHLPARQGNAVHAPPLFRPAGSRHRPTGASPAT